MRYERQIMMTEIGPEGQLLLEKAKVVVIGAGGLGSHVLYQLAAAGVGEVTIIDFDIVELSNLNRQIIHWEKDIGRPKALSAQEKLVAFNSSVQINAINIKLDDRNARELLNGHQVIVDCVDSVETRLLVNKWGILLNIPVVEGGVQGYSGFVMNIKRTKACLGCAWGDERNIPGKKPVLGAVAGTIGNLQAVQCIKILTRKDQESYSKMWLFDFMTMEYSEIEISQNENCPICGIVHFWKNQI